MEKFINELSATAVADHPHTQQFLPMIPPKFVNISPQDSKLSIIEKLEMD